MLIRESDIWCMSDILCCLNLNFKYEQKRKGLYKPGKNTRDSYANAGYSGFAWVCLKWKASQSKSERETLLRKRNELGEMLELVI